LPPSAAILSPGCPHPAGDGSEVPGVTAKPEAYLSESVNSAHASAGMLSVKPSRSVVSRTRTMPPSLAVSMQDPPLPPE
jgi:hypothetical protein